MVPGRLLLLVSFRGLCPVVLLLDRSTVWPKTLFPCCLPPSGHLTQTLPLHFYYRSKFTAPVLPRPLLRIHTVCCQCLLGCSLSLPSNSEVLGDLCGHRKTTSAPHTRSAVPYGPSSPALLSCDFLFSLLFFSLSRFFPPYTIPPFSLL